MTKIKYNMENKNSIISNLNDCISKLSVINNNFYNTYFPRDFYYINSLFSMERELITIKKDLNNYKDNIMFQAFGNLKEPTYEDYEVFLELRCFPKSRDKMKLILKDLDLPFYDPLMIIQKTEGRMAEDHFWIQIER